MEEKAKKKSKVKKFFLGLLCLIASAIIICVLSFSCFRWWIVDDSSDVQGTWQIENSNKQVLINETEIRMSEDAIFTYEIDEGSKTITEHLADKQGKVHYVFSFDRTELLLMDEDLDFFSSAFLDAGNLLSTFFSGIYSSDSSGFRGVDDSNDSIVKLHKINK